MLIIPNEGLTEQHMAEMDASNIPYERFSYQEIEWSQQNQNIVKVIEITKLVEEKKAAEQVYRWKDSREIILSS